MSVKREQDTYVSKPGELDSLPVVHAWSVVRCSNPDCPAVHMFLFDEDGKPFAHLPLDKESASQFIRDLAFACDDATGRMN